MTPYFKDDDNWNRAKTAIDGWMGTPFRHLWMTKGRGADCLFIAAVMLELGVVAKVERPFQYPQDWYLNTKIEFLLDSFAIHMAKNFAPGFQLDVLPTQDPLMRGDMVCFATIPATGVTNHAGIMLDPPNGFIHSVPGRGVTFMNWGRWWEEKMTTIYRVVN